MITSLLRKAALVLCGVVLFFVFLEAGLRLGGFILSSIQESENLRSIKQKGTYRILCLGESTTQGAYPKPLEQVLNQRNIGVRFSVIDEGRSATNTTVILSRVASHLDKYHPNMVVAMMGINDHGVRYYEDIQDSDAWLFRHCRVYRLSKILCMHMIKKTDGEGTHGSSRSVSWENAKPEKTRTAAKKSVNLEPPSDPTLDVRRGYQVQAGFRSSEESIKAIGHNPENSSNIYIQSGHLFQSAGKFSQAEDSFRKAIELDPKNDDVYILLGHLYRFADKFSQAEDSFKKAIAVNPKNDDAYIQLANFYHFTGNLAQAKNTLQKAIAVNPKNELAFFVLAGQYIVKDEFFQAEYFLKKTLELNPENGDAYFLLATLCRKQGKLPQAEELFKRAIELNPEKGRTLRAMSSLYDEMGKPELAKAYSEASRLRPVCYSITVNNYCKLNEILDRKGIKLVCVQYPMRNVEPLKRIFEKDKGVIFVDNEQVFKEAVRESGYKEYFTDMFGGDFGHCTQKGNELLAQNIADVILREVFNK
jgi:Tfp pilus assembly protein PilF